jgi:hypothetical protein
MEGLQMRTTTRLFVAILLGNALLWGCRFDPLSREEAQDALEESSVDSQAAALTSASIEVSTDFTIGQAASHAAEEIRDFVHAQLPCAEITLEDATLTIEYGALPGMCTFHGHTFSGSHAIHVERNDENDVVVTHHWDELSNGKLSVTGDATVTWDLEDPSRHVVHELTWTRLSDGRMGVGSGDRLQKPLEGGLAEGFEVDGTRSWEGDKGRWDLDIDHVQMRWADPVPQAGAWVLDTPFDKTITLEFDRIDEDSIAVTASNGDRSIELRVNSTGVVTRR